MEDAADSLAVLTKDIQRIAVRFAVVDDNRHVELNGELYHVDEHGLLDCPGRLRPMVVQSHFADGDDLFSLRTH